jgi:hypothetical protein
MLTNVSIVAQSDVSCFEMYPSLLADFKFRHIVPAAMERRTDASIVSAPAANVFGESGSADTLCLTGMEIPKKYALDAARRLTAKERPQNFRADRS